LDFSSRADPGLIDDGGRRESGHAPVSRGFLHPARELDRRTSDGVDVALVWSPASGRLAVTVRDSKTGTGFMVEVRDDERPLDVFCHPFAYAAWRRIRTDGTWAACAQGAYALAALGPASPGTLG
jgi:hypothetical protein